MNMRVFIWLRSAGCRSDSTFVDIGSTGMAGENKMLVLLNLEELEIYASVYHC